MPHNPQDRTARGRLQRAAGELGEVLERTVQTSATRPYVGWWWRPAHELEDCGCPHCQAKRAGGASYLGYQERQAIVELNTYELTHEGVAAAAA